MPTLSYNTERFTNVKKFDEVSGSYTGILVASKLNQKNGQDYKLIDIIDVDFDGAWLNATKSYINTAEDLFDAIDAIGDLEDLEWIHSKLDEHDSTLETILSTYVTQEQLDDILAQYQKPIQAGEHISIDSENVVSTYGLVSEEDADNKFATIESLDSLADRLTNDYYDKLSADTRSEEIATSMIQQLVIKNADPAFNDLEKVSDFLLSLPIDNINGLQGFIDRLDRLDDVVGEEIQDPETLSYSYTGLLKRAYDLEFFTEVINDELQEVKSTIDETVEVAVNAYNTSHTAYDYAYFAYTISLTSDQTSYEAYTMAYYSYVAVGIPHEDGYFSYLTEEQIAALNENPTYMDVYSIKENNLSGIPQKDEYNPNSGLQYYEYHKEIEATGFYKAIDDVHEIAYNAEAVAYNSLFRLYTASEEDYARLKLDPFLNDGTGVRTISIELDEADIREIDGYILSRGVITTESLYTAFSYAFTPEIISTND